MCWNLTYYDNEREQYALRPFVTAEEVELAIKTLSPEYIPRTVSQIARRTSRGDAMRVSDLEAIHRYEVYTRFGAGDASKKNATFDPAVIQKLSVMEDVYLPKNFGQYLRRLRRKAGLSQKAATSMMGLAHSSLARYETGEAFPTITVISRFGPLAEKVGLTFADIKREYIAIKYMPEVGTLGDILERERWFAQMSVKDLERASGVSTKIIRNIEKGRYMQEVPLMVNLEKMVMPLRSARIMGIVKEMRAEWSKK
jgi:ribosome-binding protein aMBF1 (putative translation factor)